MDKTLINKTVIDIRWSDLDEFHHVNNTKYFDYMQEARLRFMAENNMPFDFAKEAPVLSHTECKFIIPILYPAKIMIETYFIGIEGKKNYFEHVIKDATSNITYAIGIATIVWFDVINKKSIATPEYALKYQK